MWNQEVGRRPRHVLTTVDSALQILGIIRDEGSIRVKDAAFRMGISQASAHRILQMLAYRGFAAQDETRAYRAGLGLNVPPVSTEVILRVRVASRVLFTQFVAETGHTTSLVARFGRTQRFIETYVANVPAAVLSRRGQILPAEKTSGGKALLARLSDEAMIRLYRSPSAARAVDVLSPDRFRRLRRELVAVRALGYATNLGETEEEVAAFGMALSIDAGADLAFAVAVPSADARLFADLGFVRACEQFREALNRLADPT